MGPEPILLATNITNTFLQMLLQAGLQQEHHRNRDHHLLNHPNHLSYLRHPNHHLNIKRDILCYLYNP